MKFSIHYFFLFTVTLLFSSCSQNAVLVEEVPKKNWPFFQSSIDHKGQIDSHYTPSLSKQWMKPIVNSSKPYAPQEYASPVAGNNKVYFASLRGEGVRAYDSVKGEPIWHFEVEKGVESSPAIYEEKIYFGANDGNLYCLNANDGSLIWKYDSGAEILASPIAEGGMLFFASANNLLYALDAVTGEVLWRYKGGNGNNGIYSIRLASSPTYSDGNIYVGFSDGTVAAVVAFDGTIVWKKKFSQKRGVKFADVDASPVVDGDTLYISSYSGGFYALNKKNGETLWKVDSNSASTPTCDDNKVYLPAEDGKISAIKKEDGKKVWEYNLEKGVPTSVVIIGNYLLFGSSHDALYLLNKDSGEVVETTSASSGFSASPIFYDETIYAISNAGYIYAIK